jgi:hypothetical protein
MRRFLELVTASMVLAGALAEVAIACGSEEALVLGPSDDAGVRRDVGAVDPLEGGSLDTGSPPGPAPSCSKYCSLVTEACTLENAQYVSEKDCLALCENLPLGDAGDESSNSVACRQNFAGTPAHAVPDSYCLAAGPFGASVCGTRCGAFCQLALTTCKPGTEGAPYESYPACADACTLFGFRDAGTDGGGESPSGPLAGDTLNCRLYWLRAATLDAGFCPELGKDSGACR